VKLSVVIPVHNEEACVARTVGDLDDRLTAAGVDHEIVVVNDHSSDGSGEILKALAEGRASVRCLESSPPHGFGLAVRKGLEEYSGDAVALYMADGSDSPDDLLRFHEVLRNPAVDCAFGSRFIPGSRVIDYPVHKLILNRLANNFIRAIFAIRYNDVTNAFKVYRRCVVDGLKPFLSHHFNLTVELPLKAIVRGYSYAVIPNQWTNRKSGVSKLRVQEMGSRYLFIVLYCLLERWLSRGDYLRRNVEAPIGGETLRDSQKGRETAARL
jgi:dolichol-phosphate mannosyltransferase